MTRRVFLLVGLSILAVVLSHAAGWGQIAMFCWTDRYRSVTTPNFDQIGALAYYVLLLIRQLMVWSVPAFLFVSGFFIAYAARGNQSVLGWKMIRVRIINLLVPYLIWSIMCFIGDWLDGITYAPFEYPRRLIIGGAEGPYFYVPLLCQFYILAPFMVPIFRSRGRQLLYILALVQLITLGLRYLVLFGFDIPGFDLFSSSWPWLFIWWVFYFPFGIMCGFHVTQLRNWLVEHKRPILVAVIILGVLTIIEPEIIYRTTGTDWRFSPMTLAPSLFSVAFILCFLAFDRIPVPFPNIVHQLGIRSYAIYLIHMKAMAFIAKLIRQVAPSMLAHQVELIMPIAFVFGLGAPLLLMALVARSRAHKSYPYLFG